MTQTTQPSIPTPKTIKECLEVQSHFIGIPTITKNNYQEFYRRGKTLQIMGVGFLENGKMPTLTEVEKHIGEIETNCERLDLPKWNSAITNILNDLTTQLINMEETVKDEKAVKK